MLRFRSGLLGLACLLFTVSAQAQIAFDETDHQFGPIEEGEQATHVFTFRNTGDVALQVTHVLPSCGCTTPTWTRDPIGPGAKGTIKAVYDSEGRPGPFRKTIRVYTDRTPDATILTIEGDVRPRTLTYGIDQGSLRFEREVIDLGILAPGTPAAASLRLQNNGARPVRIQAATASADYVRVAYPQQPISAEEVADLALVVDPETLPPGQPFEAVVTLGTDDADGPQKRLYVRGRVQAAN